MIQKLRATNCSLTAVAQILLISVATFSSFILNAQNATSPASSSGGMGSVVLVALTFIILVVILMVFTISQKILSLSADTVKLSDESKSLISVFPTAREIFGTGNKYPYIGSAEVIKLKKGFNINIQGRALKETEAGVKPATFAVNPKDFIGLAPIPKLLVAEKQEVKAGDPLFYDRTREGVMFSSPVSGEVVEIRRGDKRSLEHIVILADGKNSYKEFPKGDPNTMSADVVKNQMLESGCFALLRERPYNLVANPEVKPKAIFISGFDSSPLAPNYNFTLQGLSKEFQAGIDALRKLTEGKVHLSLNAKQIPCDTYANAKNVEKHWFEGAHPVGVVGVQIHHIEPINKGDVVWTINPQHVVVIGRLFTEGRFNTEQLVAVAGPEVKAPKYFKTYQGANVESFLKENLTNDHVRIISGNVLTGKQIDKKGFLGFFDQLVSVIEEGDRYEMFGWLVPSYARPSLSPTIPWSTINPDEEFKVNTNTNGEHRALVVTGQYEEVLPMDIYPQHLIKAIIGNDFDGMEGLGIYEVVEEDLAICEFVCTSKTDVQKILREGLDYVRSQS
jgi:Na+-transporting NADH:ubiquinone oxidoreductase subunit A